MQRDRDIEGEGQRGDRDREGEKDRTCVSRGDGREGEGRPVFDGSDTEYGLSRIFLVQRHCIHQKHLVVAQLLYGNMAQLLYRNNLFT